MANPFSDTRVEELFDRARRRSRMSVRTRVDRLRSKAWHIVQCSVAAGLAWFVAAGVFRHEMPFFAPIVAVICLGMTYGQRLRRVIEVTIGVAIGVAIADLFVMVAGSGPWQIAAVVLVSMSIALLLDAGQLLVMQSAVQSIVVTVLVPEHGQAVTRWVDAVIGGAVALVFATLVPAAPLRRPRVVAAGVARAIADLLRDAARSVDDGDVQRSADLLSRARESDALIRELQAAADEGLAVVQSTPWSRSDAGSVRTIASVVEPLDRALRSTRVMVRRVSIAAYHEATIPGEYVAMLAELAAAVDVLARAWSENKSPEFARPALLAAAESTAVLPAGEYHTTVLLGQVRSLVVDLLELTGLDHEAAVAAVPRRAT